jgi:hypothetical protein
VTVKSVISYDTFCLRSGFATVLICRAVPEAAEAFVTTLPHVPGAFQGLPSKKHDITVVFTGSYWLSPEIRPWALDQLYCH